MAEKTRIRITRKVLSAYDRTYGVTMYIDINTCDFLDGYQFDIFTDQILNVFKQLDRFYFLRKIHIYGDLKKYHDLEECPLSAVASTIVKHFPSIFFLFFVLVRHFKLCFVIFLYVHRF